MVRYREIRPSARLRHFVSNFWILEHVGEDSAPQRVVPDGHSELILNWEQPFEFLQDGAWHGQPRCFLAGQIEGPLLLRATGPARMLGIGFHPHGAAQIFRQPMGELTGQFTPIEDLSTRLFRDLSDIAPSHDPVGAVEAALLAASEDSRNDALIEEAVRRIVLSKGAADLARLARDLNVSLRQFERRFQATVGLTPKLFCRIQRFSGVFRMIEEPARNWADAALACGYYDQAHLIHECRALAGTTPPRLLAEDADLARHFYQRFGVSHSYKTAARDSG